MAYMKNEQVKVSVEADMKAWLKAVANKRRCSISQVVVELILAAMEQPK